MAESRVRDWKWSFWTVLALSLPSFTGLLIMVSALVRPSVWVSAEAILLYLYIPVTLTPAVLIAAVTRKSMQHYWRRNTWLVLTLAAFAVLVTVILLTWLGRTRR